MIAACGCSNSTTPNTVLTSPADFSDSDQQDAIADSVPDVGIQITDAALPILRSAFDSAEAGEAIVFSMDWPAGVCSMQHRLEIAPPDSTHQTIVVSGIRFAFESKYGKFVNGTLIDYGTRGTDSGLIVTHPGLDFDSIVHSESDSALMAEMLGSGFQHFRDGILRGVMSLEPSLE